jgi:hypothetical protein
MCSGEAGQFGRIAMRKGFCRGVLSGILIAWLCLTSGAHADTGSREREPKKEKVQLTVVEKKQSEKPDRNRGEQEKQRSRDRKS